MSKLQFFGSLSSDEQLEVLEGAIFALTGQDGREHLDLSDEYCARLVEKIRGFMNEE